MEDESTTPMFDRADNEDSVRRRSRPAPTTVIEHDPTDSIAYHAAVEAFRPEDVDTQTHDTGRCHLDVQVCPACNAIERDEGPVREWELNPDLDAEQDHELPLDP